MGGKVSIAVGYKEGDQAQAGADGRREVPATLGATRPNDSRSAAVKVLLRVTVRLPPDHGSYGVEGGILALPDAGKDTQLVLVGDTVTRLGACQEGGYTVEGIDDGVYGVTFLREHIISFDFNAQRVAELERLDRSPLTLKVTPSHISYFFFNGVGNSRVCSLTAENYDVIRLKWEQWMAQCRIPSRMLAGVLSNMKSEKPAIKEVRLEFRKKPDDGGYVETKSGEGVPEDQALCIASTTDPGRDGVVTNWIDCSVVRSGGEASDGETEQFTVYARTSYAPDTVDAVDAAADAAEDPRMHITEGVGGDDGQAFRDWTESLTDVSYGNTFDLEVLADMVQRLHLVNRTGHITLSLPGNAISNYDFIVLSTDSGNRVNPEPGSADLQVCCMVAPKADVP